MKKLLPLCLLVLAAHARAQSSSVSLPSSSAAPASAAPAASAGNTSMGTIQGGTMALLREKLQVRYFAEFLGPSVERWDDNQVDVDGKGNYARSDDPINMFNQFSVRWLVAPDTRVLVEPRFTLQFGDRNDVVNSGRASGSETDGQVIVQEDHRLAMMRTNYWKSAGGTLTQSVRGGVRLPTSQASQNANVTLQPELLDITSWQATPKINVGYWKSVRYYWFEPKADAERWRLYNSLSTTYSFNDRWELYFQYEHEMQHNQPEGKRRLNYIRESLQDLYAGVNFNVTPSLTLYPFVRFAQVKKWEPETMQVGAWIMGAVF